MTKALYIHIPFCDRICSYCDFAKMYSSFFDHKIYLEALIKEIDSLKIPDDSLKTIYIGGGTPSCLSNEELAFLLRYLKSHFHSLDEFTLEANPESLTREKIRTLVEYGINRVSLGVQSANEATLKILNRNHTLFDVKECVKNLNDLSLTNYNLDFIYGLPNMTMADLEEDIRFSFSLQPKHLSYYSLQIEEGTLLYQKKLPPIGEETYRRMYDFLLSELEKHSFFRYEVSNFSLPGYESKHNLTYWRDEHYYAAGVSASGYLENRRYTNTRSIQHYVQGQYNRSEETVTKKDEEFEFLMLNLRLAKGFSLSRFEERFKKNFLLSYQKEIEKVREYTQIKDDFFSIKKEYLYTMDSILLEILK